MALAGTAPAFLRSGLAAPSDRINLGFIGVGGMGTSRLNGFLKHADMNPVAVCDLDSTRIDKAVERIKAARNTTPQTYGDFRKLLENKEIDAVCVATPDHWHAIPLIQACKAGKDVFVEKPLSYSIGEGRAMVKAAREGDREVVVGLHRRVSPHCISGMEFLKSGKVGKIGMVRLFAHAAGGAGEKTPDSEPPKGMDWDLWLGPAPKRAFNKAIHPKGFRHFLDYANGTLGDWGVHWFDQLYWWTDELHPKRVYSTGGRFVRQDSTDAPDTQIMVLDYEGFKCTWEQRHYAGNSAEATPIGAYFYGTNGTFHQGWRDGWTWFPANKNEKTIHVEPQLNSPDGQNIKELWADFLISIKQRRRPVRDIEIGYRATSTSLLGMVSMKLGRAVEWDGKNIPNDAEANKLLRRTYRDPWKYPEI